MVKKRRRTIGGGDWHHRVPDFQLVYCGPKGLGETVKAEAQNRSKDIRKKRKRALAEEERV